ncbi:MAG: DUF1905 domain-containing protein [Hydrogenophaga sp.]|nr:DUF1905 domain-containing protein [Hydrogenophaga sp.]
MEAWEFEADLFEYGGKGSWHFVTLPADVAFAIRCVTGNSRSGWGMVAVTAEIAGVAFRTSLFTEKASSSYLLPVKAAVRKAARLKTGDRINVRIALQP